MGWNACKIGKGLWCCPGRYEYPYKTRCQEIFRRTLYRKFQPSKNVTGGYHYHTIEAESEEILDDIQNELAEKGFLMQSRRQSGISGTDAF